MVTINKILTFFYNTATFKFLRVELKRKIKSIVKNVLSHSVNELSEQITELHEKQVQLHARLTELHGKMNVFSGDQKSLFDNQNNYLNNVAKEDRSWHVDLKHMHAHADKKHDEQLFLLRNLHENQGCNAYYTFYEQFVKEFASIIKKIVKNDYPHITANIENIFSEILIGNTLPGWIWRLRRDLTSFQAIVPPISTTGNYSRMNDPSQSKSLKILIISGTFPSLMHGGGNRLFDIILELSKNNHIDLYTYYDPACDESSLAPIENAVDNLKLVDFPEFTAELVGSWLRSINHDNNFYDIIQLEYPPTIRFIPHMRRYGKKIGVTFMESLSKSFTEKLEQTLEAQNYDNIAEICNSFWTSMANEKFALENADFTIVVTPQDKDFLQRMSNKRPNIIPTCVSSFAIIEEGEKLSDIIQQEDKTVMFLGFFGHWPNIEAVEWYLTEIHPRIKFAIHGYKFYVVGSGDVSKINELTEGDDTVVVTGRVTSVVPNILQARLCISPLISGAGIRGKQNQYSLLNRPSVTTSIGNSGLEYVHEESVMIADSALDFADAIIRMLTDKVLYAKIQANAKKIAMRHYTWNQYIPKIDEIYRDPATMRVHVTQGDAQ